MKIAYIITRSDAIGGAQIHVRDMAASLRSRGHQSVVGVGGDGPFVGLLREAGIDCEALPHLVRSIRPVSDARAICEMTRFLRRHRPDIVSLHSSKAGWLGRIAAWWERIPVIFTAHGWAFTEGIPSGRRAVYYALERLSPCKTPVVITVSQHDRDLAIRLGIMPSDRLVCIHNGSGEIPDTLRGNPRKSPPIVTMVGRLDEQKNPELLVRALGSLGDVEWSLELIGDGPGKNRVATLARQVGVMNRVHLLGARNDVAACLARSQIFALSSNWEGFPRTIIEAMRAGLPVIATSVGGVAEAVKHNETGLVVPRRSEEALSSALLKLLTNPALRAEMGAAGRRRYEEHFRLETMVSRTLSEYERLLSLRDGRS